MLSLHRTLLPLDKNSLFSAQPGAPWNPYPHLTSPTRNAGAMVNADQGLLLLTCPGATHLWAPCPFPICRKERGGEVWCGGNNWGL